MLGDFLIECRCAMGHESSATFRSFPRWLVENIARAIPDCCHASPDEGDECGARVAPVISVLSLRTPARPVPRTTTKPSMAAVQVVVDNEVESEGESPTQPPPRRPPEDDRGSDC